MLSEEQIQMYKRDGIDLTHDNIVIFGKAGYGKTFMLKKDLAKQLKENGVDVPKDLQEELEKQEKAYEVWRIL